MTDGYERRPQTRRVQTVPGHVFVDESPRCTGEHRGKQCNKLLAEFLTRPWSITCSRCGNRNRREGFPRPTAG